MHGHVGFVGAVHAEHADELRVRTRQRTKAHQGQGARVAGLVNEIGKFLTRRRAGVDDSAAAVKNRTFRIGQQFNRCFDCVRMAFGLRAVARVLHFFRSDIGAVGELDVFRQINHDRARSTAAGDVKGLMHGPGQ